MPLFVGEFEQAIDAKHRLAIPMALREQMDPDDDGSNFILVLGPDRHLWLYPDQWYKRLLASLRRSPLPDRDSGKLDFLFAMARIVKPDKQGRIVLPERSMKRARIDDRVTLVGGYDHIVIWPTGAWEQRVEQRLANYSDEFYEVADRLKEQMTDR